MTHRCLNYALAQSVWTFCLQCCSTFHLLLAYNIIKDDASMYESVCLNLLFAHASLQYVEIPVRVADNDFLFLRNYLCRNLNIWKKLLSSSCLAFHAIGIWCCGVKLLFPYQKMSKLMTVLGCSLLFYVVFFFFYYQKTKCFPLTFCISSSFLGYLQVTECYLLLEY